MFCGVEDDFQPKNVNFELGEPFRLVGEADAVESSESVVLERGSPADCVAMAVGVCDWEVGVAVEERLVLFGADEEGGVDARRATSAAGLRLAWERISCFNGTGMLDGRFGKDTTRRCW